MKKVKTNLTKRRTARKTALAAMLAAALAGCDYAQRRELKDERADRHYQAAMSDYAAGKLDSAIRNFEKAVRANPANASARFQLACLMQDRGGDLLGALCNYREFMALEPSSDKAALAKSRAALCEKQLAAEIVRKSVSGGVISAAEHADALAASAAASNALAKAQARTAGLEARIAALEEENGRLRRMLSSAGGEEGGAPRRAVESARQLLDDEEEDDGRLRLPAAAAALVEDEERDDARPPAPGPGREGPSLADTAQIFRKRAGGSPTGAADAANPAERPETYIVQEGDTLYRIALRFYGRRDAWRGIQEANKATVSSDGRIKTGQKLRLP